ncbi:hypothetical protein [Anoxybacillus sp. PDR2]|uniref:hypothetical protein n=1 Tax=Anoxybacillus sp. PDR2 TaxID=1636720 RepID=UPI001F2C932D|nr:hypothetical protein [Anoxybacillus sp. PDR2]
MMICSNLVKKRLGLPEMMSRYEWYVENAFSPVMNGNGEKGDAFDSKIVKIVSKIIKLLEKIKCFLFIVFLEEGKYGCKKDR